MQIDWNKALRPVAVLAAWALFSIAAVATAQPAQVAPPEQVVPPAPPGEAALTPPPKAPKPAPVAAKKVVLAKPLAPADKKALRARAEAAFSELETLGGLGYRAPGYKAYHLGQLELVRGEMKIRPVVGLETRIGLLAGEDAQLSRGDLIERRGFAVPRARFGFKGQFAKKVPFAVVTDLAGTLLNQAWFGYEAHPYAKLYFGARTIPFSRSAILSSGNAGLTERSRAVDAMAPFRQVGVSLEGLYKAIGLSWSLGVYNGFDRVGVFHEGVRSNAGLHGNRIGGLAGVGRVDLAPLGEIGDSVYDYKGGGLRLNVGGGGYYNDSGSASTVAYSGDLHVKIAGSHLLVEFLQDGTSPLERPEGTQPTLTDLTRRAIVAEAGHMFQKLSVSLRAELIDPNTAKEDSNDELWLSAALGWHFVRDMLRVQIQYDHRRELHGPVYDNDALYAKMMLRL